MQKAPVTIKIDQDGDDSDAERGTTIDDKMIPGLGINGVTTSVDWNNLTDSEIIHRTVYGPDIPSYELAVVGNGRGSIYNNKIKTLNLSIWFNNKVVDFMNGLLMQKFIESCLRQEPG